MHSIYLAYLSIGMLPRLDGETDDAIRAKILGACALRIWLCHHQSIRIPLVHIHSWAGRDIGACSGPVSDWYVKEISNLMLCSVHYTSLSTSRAPDDAGSWPRATDTWHCKFHLLRLTQEQRVSGTSQHVRTALDMEVHRGMLLLTGLHDLAVLIAHHGEISPHRCSSVAPERWNNETITDTIEQGCNSVSIHHLWISKFFPPRS